MSSTRIIFTLAKLAIPIAVNVTVAPIEKLVSCEFSDLDDAENFVAWADKLGIDFNFKAALEEAVETELTNRNDLSKIDIIFEERIYQAIILQNKPHRRLTQASVQTLQDEIEIANEQIAREQAALHHQEFVGPGFDTTCETTVFKSTTGSEFLTEILIDSTNFTQCRFANLEDAAAFLAWVNTLKISATPFDIVIDETYRQKSTFAGKNAYTIRFKTNEFDQLLAIKNLQEQKVDLSPKMTFTPIGSISSAFTKLSPERLKLSSRTASDDEEKVVPKSLSLFQHTSAATSSSSAFISPRSIIGARANLNALFEEQEAAARKEQEDLLQAIALSQQHAMKAERDEASPDSFVESKQHDRSWMPAVSNAEQSLSPSHHPSSEAQLDFIEQTAEGAEQEEEDVSLAIRTSRSLSNASTSLSRLNSDPALASRMGNYVSSSDAELIRELQFHLDQIEILSAEVMNRSINHPEKSLLFKNFLKSIGNREIQIAIEDPLAEALKKSLPSLPSAVALGSSMSAMLHSPKQATPSPTNKPANNPENRFSPQQK
ncbi:MAG: hypothetical protein P4M14_11500 [Gammaproteobacteria bacterium]|nr:hypothetical protein [Gammaproteobacteria bacterium]